MLDARWCDLDELIAARSGQSIPEIFAIHGEAHFRELERAAMVSALHEPPQVIAAGGGWASQPGNLGVADPGALVVLLSVTPEQAAARLGTDSGRPLLGRLPLPKLRELAAARARWDALAGVEIAADGVPDAVAAGVVTAARQYGGW